MATNTKKLYDDANNEYLNNKSAVENYGSFTTSDRLNNIQSIGDNALNSMVNYGTFDSAKLLADEAQKKQNAESAVANYGNFQYNLQDSYDNVINSILNREDFSYDVNGDALYQQYKDQYITQGKLASQDVMGQAAAMTGGYSNSYAATVGNQAYQGYLQQLNDKVPELYKLALDKYNSEGDQLYNKYDMLRSDRATQYGEWGDGYNRLVADRDYYANNYNNAYNQKYGEWADQFNMLGSIHDAATNAYNTGFTQENTIWQNGLDQLIDQRNSSFDYAVEMANQHEWQQEFDAKNSQWQAEFDEMVRVNDAEITSKAQETAANNCYSAIEQGVMPSDDMIKQAGLDKSTVSKMVTERKNVISLANQQTQANIDNTKANTNAAKIDLSNYTSNDDIEVDPVTGDITGVKGHTLAGDKTVARAQTTASVSGFKSNSGDNFKITVNGNTYKVENDGKVTDQKIIDALKGANAANNTVVTYNGDMYVANGGAYYKVGSRNIIGEWGTLSPNVLTDLLKNMK